MADVTPPPDATPPCPAPPSESELREWERLCAEATEEPWEAYAAPCCPDMGGVCGPARQSICDASVGSVGHPMELRDAAFTAVARSALPRLLAAVRDPLAPLTSRWTVGEHVQVRYQFARGEPEWMLSWRREYADVLSCWRSVEASTLAEAVAKAVAWEEANDREEPDHA